MKIGTGIAVAGVAASVVVALIMVPVLGGLSIFIGFMIFLIGFGWMLYQGLR